MVHTLENMNACASLGTLDMDCMETVLVSDMLKMIFNTSSWNNFNIQCHYFINFEIVEFCRKLNKKLDYSIYNVQIVKLQLFVEHSNSFVVLSFWWVTKCASQLQLVPRERTRTIQIQVTWPLAYPARMRTTSPHAAVRL